MNLKLAYASGKATGLQIGQNQAHDFEGDNADEFVSQVCEHESEVWRQYTPFEITAKDLNESAVPDSSWDEYDRGVAVGARQAWEEHRRTPVELAPGYKPGDETRVPIDIADKRL